MTNAEAVYEALKDMTSDLNEDDEISVLSNLLAAATVKRGLNPNRVMDFYFSLFTVVMAPVAKDEERIN